MMEQLETGNIGIGNILTLATFRNSPHCAAEAPGMERALAYSTVSW